MLFSRILKRTAHALLRAWQRPAPSTRVVMAFCIRGLALVNFAAFSSLRPQVKGLFGVRGVAPVRARLEDSRVFWGRVPDRALWLRQYPTLFWANADDRALERWCRVGQGASLALALGIAPRSMVALLWAVQLSFISTGSPFLNFQWDLLLLEADMHAFALLLRRRGARPPAAAVWLMRLLAFRLNFESGLAKLQSKDRTWRDRTAMSYHYETQPIPNRLAWYAHQLPLPVQKFSTATSLAIEILAPFLMFGGRRGRRLAFGLLGALQGAILTTGNFAFFNLLTLVIQLSLLDDEALPSALRRPFPPAAPRALGILRNLPVIPALAMAGSELLVRARPHARVPNPLRRMAGHAMALRTLNTYGLFANMTTRRPEVVVEGSLDGNTWRPYTFRFKPGDPARAPRQVAPHQPRLDWQMWFAALGPAPQWFVDFVVRLLEGSPDVLGLLETNPFLDHPPRIIRARLYDYHFTDASTRRATGAWWTRRYLGEYLPPVQLGAPR